MSSILSKVMSLKSLFFFLLLQIYDLSVDALSPMYYFLLPSSKIRDATFLFNEEGKNIIVIMSSAGYMYTQMMDESSSAQHGPFYVTNVLEINHEDLKVLQWFIFLYSQIDCSKLTKWIQNGLSVTACWVCCVFASQDSNGQVAGGGVSVYYSPRPADALLQLQSGQVICCHSELQQHGNTETLYHQCQRVGFLFLF